MVTYIIVTHNKQNDTLETSNPFFSHEEACNEMWKNYANHLNMNVETAKKYGEENGFAFGEYYVSDATYDTEIHSVIFSEDDMLTMLILDTFYKLYPEFADYSKGEWRVKFQDMLVKLINKTLPRFKTDYKRVSVEDFVNDCLIGEEMYESALENLGGKTDSDSTDNILTFIGEIPTFTSDVIDAYPVSTQNAVLCGLLVLSSGGDEDFIEKTRESINHWCEVTNQEPIFVEPQYVYRVSAYYDMDIMKDEEIIQEIYATEELAQKRVRHLIDTYKNECHTIEDCEPYDGEWDENEYRLYAWVDSKWNVDIFYVKEEVRNNLEQR